MTPPGSGPARNRHQSAESPTSDRWRLDESQLRAALLQLDLAAQSAGRASANELAFHRADIAAGRGEFATIRLAPTSLVERQSTHQATLRKRLTSNLH